MVRRHSTGLDADASADGMEGLLDLGTISDHAVAIDSADVVQIDIDGQARHVEPEHVESRAALEDHSLLQKRMAASGLQQLQEQDHLLERLCLEAGRSNPKPVLGKVCGKV